MQLFYNGLKEEVKDVLYDRDRPDTLDEYIAMAIKIDDRQYSRKQQRKGRGGGLAGVPTQRQEETPILAALRMERMLAPWTSTPHRRGPPRKDKTDVTCYNCGKKGTSRGSVALPRRDWKPVPGKGSSGHRQAHPSARGRRGKLRLVGR